jgi:hypothetical protein
MRCFGKSKQSTQQMRLAVWRVSLDNKAVQALANLLPLLGCGEEAATVAFYRLANQDAFAQSTQTALRFIGDEEHVHDALLSDLASALPTAENDIEIRRTARRFHMSLAKGGPVLHLARIAAIDGAVCMMLSRLIAPHARLSDDAAVANLFRRIRNDEARHVAVARGIALSTPDRASLREAGANARSALAMLIAPGADAFDQLGVDPDRLMRDVAQLPNGLL